MKKLSYLLIICTILTGCVQTSAVPLGKNMAEINVSADKIYKRADAYKFAFIEAAKTTIEYGYERFEVMDNQGWNEGGISGGSWGNSSASFNAHANNNYGSAYGYGNSSGGSSWGTTRSPEAKMVIKMLRKGDKGFNDAVDAQTVIDKHASKPAFSE